ncbi:MAG: RES family NAD+ phosphorylase [Candidatus Binatia bacterium]
MTLWRISNHADLRGMGGLRASGRWHTTGRPIVYLAEHPALCLLEALAHDLDPSDLPRRYRWLKVDTRPSTSIADATGLPRNWMTDPAATRAIGDRWLAESRSALLRVPSVLAPESFNYLLNPAHARARGVRVAAAFSYPLDPRLMRGA